MGYVSDMDNTTPRIPTMSITNIRVTIRRDNFIPSKPWHADLRADDGTPDGLFLKSWQQFFRTKSAMIREIRAAEPSATIIDTDGRAIG